MREGKREREFLLLSFKTWYKVIILHSVPGERINTQLNGTAQNPEIELCAYGIFRQRCGWFASWGALWMKSDNRQEKQGQVTQVGR